MAKPTPRKRTGLVTDPSGAVKREQPKLLPQPFVQQLRNIVAPEKGKKGSWMKLLNDVQLGEIYTMLRSGKSARKVAAHIQEKWNLFEDVRVQNLVPAIINFRREALGDIWDLPDFHYEESKADALAVINALRQKGGDAVKNIDALSMLADVILLERGRIEVRHANEQITGKVDSALSKDVSQFASLLDIMAAMQHKLGLLDYKLQPSANNQLGFNAALEGLPEGTARLAQAAQSFMKAVQDLPTRTLVQRPDGSYAVELSLIHI